MKKDIIIIALIAILFVLVAGSILASFTFYKEYKDKIDSLEQQSESSKSKVTGLETKVDGYKASIEDITNQVKTYSDSLKSVQNTITLSDEERKALLSKLEDMKKDLVGLQKDYSSAITDMKQGMMVMKEEMDKAQSKAKNVELGHITVKQDDKTAPAPDAQNSAKKTAAPNVKSGNVRKAGIF